jgi:hypothetical protein
MITEALEVISGLQSQVKGSWNLINLAYSSGDAIQLKFSICKRNDNEGEVAAAVWRELCRQRTGADNNGYRERRLFFVGNNRKGKYVEHPGHF